VSTTSRRTSALGTIGFMAGAVVFAAMAGVLVSQLLENRYSQEPVRSVVVVNHDVPAGVPLRAQDLTMADWPQSAVPRGVFTRVKQVVDSKRVPLVPLVKGQPVLVSQLSRANAGIGVASLIEEGKRAVSIKTDDPVTLAQLVYPGARVDVLSTAQRQSKRGGTYMQTRTVLQDVRVLAVGEDIDPLTVARRRKPHKEGEEGSPFGAGGAESKEVRRVITVLVTPEEAEALSQAEREGKIYIALRNPRDRTVRQAKTATRTPPPPPAEEADWGVTVKREETPKPRKKRARRKVKVASAPRIRIFRGGR